MSGRIYGIESVRSRTPGKGNVLRLKVNFTPEVITLAKEVRNARHALLYCWLNVTRAFCQILVYRFSVSI